MMRTFDKKNFGNRPPPFPHTPQKNLGRRVCVDHPEHTFCGGSRDFFFLSFKNMSRKGTITSSGGKNYFNPQTFRGPIVNKNFSRAYKEDLDPTVATHSVPLCADPPVGFTPSRMRSL